MSVTTHTSSAPPPAIAWPETAAAFRANFFARVVLSWVGLIAGVVALPGTVLCIELTDPEYPVVVGKLAVFGMALGPILLCLGLWCGFVLWRRRRMMYAVRNHPWVVWPVRYEPGRHETMVLVDHENVRVADFTISSSGPNRRAVVNENSTQVWFAGNPLRRGVIALPGGGCPLYVFRYGTAKPGGAYRAPESKKETEAPKPSHDYPPPGRVRRTLSFALDLVIHLGIALTVAFLVVRPTSFEAITTRHFDVSKAEFWILLAWPAASFIDRVIIQSVFHTTLGKALFGLCVIRPDTGRFPSFGRLLKVWFVDLYMVIVIPLALIALSDAPGPDRISDYLLPAVRRNVIGRMETTS